MMPFSTFLLASFFSTISRPLIEAARLDGAGAWRVFWEIVLPLSFPALMTVVIVQSLWVWNEVLVAVIFLQDQGLRTLMVGLTLFNSRYRHDVPIVMASRDDEVGENQPPKAIAEEGMARAIGPCRVGRPQA